MRGAYIFSACCFVVKFCNVSPQAKGKNPGTNEEGTTTSDSEGEEYSGTQDHHTFIALIDIVFMNQLKRTCTGAIIHDYVVITAGHCFINQGTRPELTLSFIVIGTKKMFKAGYEQYLPIERYKIHPQISGWTADLALVYTFAAMTSDKSGKVIRMVSNKITNPTDQSVTVLSWGRFSDKATYGPWKVYTSKVTRSTASTSPDEDDYERVRVHMKRMLARKTDSFERSDDKTRTVMIKRGWQTTTRVHLQNKFRSYYANWRRKMGPQQNNLTVEVFSINSPPTCKKAAECLIPPPPYEIGESDQIVCYSSDDHFIGREDAGAPAIRHGRLFAITIGGVLADGEQVGIGMHLSCYCSWIVANLPSGHSVKCCKNCCNINTTPAKISSEQK